MKKSGNEISNFSIERLLLYSRCVSNIRKRKKRDKILSSDIASLLNIDSTQVRKDLSHIGKLGKRGLGYFVNSLLDSLNKFLYRNKVINTAIIGIGKLGAALIGYKVFKQCNINIVAGFDIDKRKIGAKVNKIPIYHIDNLKRIIKSKKIQIGVITTPASAAYEIAQMLKDAKIKAIINFAPIYISFPDHPIVENIDLSIFFEIVRYKIISQKKKNI